MGEFGIIFLRQEYHLPYNKSASEHGTNAGRSNGFVGCIASSRNKTANKMISPTTHDTDTAWGNSTQNISCCIKHYIQHVRANHTEVILHLQTGYNWTNTCCWRIDRHGDVTVRGNKRLSIDHLRHTTDERAGSFSEQTVRTAADWTTQAGNATRRTRNRAGGAYEYIYVHVAFSSW